MTAILKTHLKTHIEYAHISRHPPNLQAVPSASTPEVWVHKVNPPNIFPSRGSIFGNLRKRDFSSCPSLNSCQTPLLKQSEGVHTLEYRSHHASDHTWRGGLELAFASDAIQRENYNNVIWQCTVIQSDTIYHKHNTNADWMCQQRHSHKDNQVLVLWACALCSVQLKAW